jgi:hypothetical protein
MRIVRLAFVSALSALTLGCTKGSPNFDSLGADNIPQPLFSGATQETLNASSTSQTFSISGDCDSKIRDISGIAVGTPTGFASLASMAAGAVTVDCAATGHFSFTLKSLNDLGYTAISGQTYNIQLRAITSGGTSNPSTIHLAFSTAGGSDPKHILLTSGSTASTSGGPRLASGTAFKAEIRVTNKVLNYGAGAGTQDAMTLKTGTAFQMRSGLSAQSN